MQHNLQVKTLFNFRSTGRYRDRKQSGSLGSNDRGSSATGRITQGQMGKRLSAGACCVTANNDLAKSDSTSGA